MCSSLWSSMDQAGFCRSWGTLEDAGELIPAQLLGNHHDNHHLQHWQEEHQQQQQHETMCIVTECEAGTRNSTGLQPCCSLQQLPAEVHLHSLQCSSTTTNRCTEQLTLAQHQLLQHQLTSQNQRQQHHRLLVHQVSSQLKLLPALDLSVVRFGKDDAVKNLPSDCINVSAEIAAKEAELCFEGGSILPENLHPHALLQDSRCYIYEAVSSQESSALQDLLSRLPERESCEVVGLWEALLVARRDCEMMAARGVRISRDISRDWQETVSDLIDRVVLQDKELTQLRAQLQATPSMPSFAVPAAASDNNADELHAQLVRLRRQRDKLAREQQELGRLLLEAQEALRLAQHHAAATQEQLAAINAANSTLREQHSTLLQQHIHLACYAEQLEAAVFTGGPKTAQLEQSLGAGTLSPRAAACSIVNCSHRSPLCWLFPPAGSSNAGQSLANMSALPAQAHLVMNCSGAGVQACAADDGVVGADGIATIKRPLAGLSALPQALASMLGDTGGRKSSSPRAASSLSTTTAAAAAVVVDGGRGEGSAATSPGGSGGRRLWRGPTPGNTQLVGGVATKRSLAASARPGSNENNSCRVPRAAESSDDSLDTGRESSTASPDQTAATAAAAAVPAVPAGQMLAGGVAKAGSRLHRPSGTAAGLAFHATESLAAVKQGWNGIGSSNTGTWQLKDIRLAAMQQLQAITAESPSTSVLHY